MSGGAYHGGEFFSAIGTDFRTLYRNEEVISADVLDAWFDPSPRVLETLREYLPFLLRTSPPVRAEGLVRTISEVREVPEQCILAGSGSSALIFCCLPALLPERPRILLADPTYGEYSHVAGNLLEADVTYFRLMGEPGFRVRTDDFIRATKQAAANAVLLVNPNNPTGIYWRAEELLRWLDSLPETTIVWVDEAYLEYAAWSRSLEREACRRRNLFVLKSMSKVYALSGMRVAYLVGAAQEIARLSRRIPPWPVGLDAQVAAVEALRDPEWYAARYQETRRLREETCCRLAQNRRLRVCASDVNFYLLETDNPTGLADRLRKQEIFVRQFRAEHSLSSRFLRVSVKSREQNERIARVIEENA